MLLVVDVGNTQTVFGLYESEKLRADWRLSTHHNRSADEWAVEVAAILGQRPGQAYKGKHSEQRDSILHGAGIIRDKDFRLIR